jgi:tetratricopeptide (TPR) repeat protein
MTQGDYTKAISLYDKMLKMDPSLSAVWCDKGDALTNLKRYPEAISAYETGLEMNPSNAAGWIHKGDTYVLLKDYNSAITCYNTALIYDQGQYRSLLNRKISEISGMTSITLSPTVTVKPVTTTTKATYKSATTKVPTFSSTRFTSPAPSPGKLGPSNMKIVNTLSDFPINPVYFFVGISAVFVAFVIFDSNFRKRKE